jgi:predicted TIM-barrel enzyme
MKVNRRSIFLLLLNPLALAKLSYQNHLTQNLITEMIKSLIVNNEEHLLRALADTGASSSIILEAYTSAPFIKTEDNNTTTWSTMVGESITVKTGICL